MIHPCDKPCGNKTASGYCATTVCINPQYSNIGTAQYGQGVHKSIITNADRIRGYTDEELAGWYWWMLRYVQGYTDSRVALLDWLKQEVVSDG